MVNETTVFTVGHSTRSIDDFLAILRAHRIVAVVDVRRFPASRRHPQFGRDALDEALRHAGIDYVHLSDLGGRRSPRPDSPNTSWRAAGFRGYADYMRTQPFRAALQQVVDLAAAKRVALMCAEAVPWRCHRQLIADALAARGHQVVHLLATDRTERHVLNPAARQLEDGGLVYPAPVNGQPDLFTEQHASRGRRTLDH